MRFIILVSSIIFCFSVTAQNFESQVIFLDENHIPLLGNKPYVESEFTVFAVSSNVKHYQIGEEWDRQDVSNNQLLSSKIVYKLAAQTGRIRGATGFYLGVYSGKHVFATNYHVCPNFFYCGYKNVQFDILNESIPVGSAIGSWSEIDLALYTLDVPHELESKFNSIGQNFNFNWPQHQGAELITLGYGIGNNQDQNLTVAMGNECRLFSDNNVLMPDPDQINKLSYKVWSFAMGCDVSHGDSGALVADLQTGSIVGLVWTGKIPKREYIQDNAFLNQVLSENNQEVIWNDLNYAVPAEKIREKLVHELNFETFKPWQRQVLIELLSY